MTNSPLPAAPEGPRPHDPELLSLQRAVDAHPIWSCRLLQQARAGQLTLADYRHLFAQYYAYSRRFTRYLAAVMAGCDDDHLRARLSQNLWEEGGGATPEGRHSKLFRDFLSQTLALESEPVAFADYAERFSDRYLRATASGDIVYAAAYLGLGTEGIIARLYSIFVEGLCKIGVADESLTFFHLHIRCDDAHAETLTEILLASRKQPGFLSRAQLGVSDALDARLEFFDAVSAHLDELRYQPLLDRIRERKPLGEIQNDADQGRYRAEGSRGGEALYENTNPRLGIRFSVERLRFPGAQVLDPRVVSIPPGCNNEKHRHAHESLFYIISGEARVLIGERFLEARAGDTVFVPRWILHQSTNIGAGELRILAITDFGLTSAVLGDYDRRTRLAVRGTDAIDG